MSDTIETAIAMIAAERQRQIDMEGYTTEHDAKDGAATLLLAAGCYLADWCQPGTVPSAWPWARQYWKPKGAIRNLVRAGALAQASIDVAPSPGAQSVYDQSVARLALTLSEARSTTTHLRAGIEALADEWEAESRRLTAFIDGTPGPGSLFAGSPERRHARIAHQYAAELRALLSADDEKAAR